jgi:hypothetical protein
MQEIHCILYAKSSYGSSIVKLARFVLVDVGDLFVLVIAQTYVSSFVCIFTSLIDRHHNEKSVRRASLTAFVRNSNK